MRKKNNDHSRHCPISSCTKGAIIILMALVLVISPIVAIVISSTANSKVKELEHQISQITTQQQADMDSPTEQTVAFLESELQRHREFIQDQEAHLIWLVSAVGALAIFLLSITGLSNRRDIKNTIEENYLDQIDEQLYVMIDGEENKQYLKNAVEQEKMARQKKILFFYWNEIPDNENSRKVLNYVENELKLLKFHVDSKIIFPSYRMQDFQLIIQDYDVIVYEIDKEEDFAIQEGEEIPAKYFVDKNNNHNNKQVPPKEEWIYPKNFKTYKYFCEACEKSEKYGILYYPKNNLKGFYTLPRFYTAMANMRLTLKQLLFSILYH